MKIEQIAAEEIIHCLNDENVYMINFTEKQEKPTINKVMNSKVKDVLSANLYVRFIHED